MKHLFVSIISVGMCVPMAFAQTNTIPEGMEITAQQWCKNVTAGWNLGNTFESSGANWQNDAWTSATEGNWNSVSWDWNKAWNNDLDTWETAWGNPAVTKSMIKAVKDAGFNAIRIPVRWLPHVTDESTMSIDPDWVNRVKEVVDWCLEYDMYVLINTHHELWLEYNPYYQYKERINTHLGKLWTNIATAFADYDGRLAFAGVNEVVHNGSWQSPSSENNEVTNSYHQTFVNAVRATGGKNLYRNLVVQTYSCNPDYGFSGLVVPTDQVEGRMSVEFHYYQPWDYCGAGTVYSWDDVNTLKNVMNRAKTAWWDKGYGVMVGEYGCTMHYQADATSEVQEQQKQNVGLYCKTIVSVMRELGFAGFVWDNNAFGSGEDKFGIFDRANNMACGNTYVLSGIIEGSGQEYKTPDEDASTTASSSEWYGNAGTQLWEGNAQLSWGDGLQLTIPTSDLAALTDGSNDNLLVLYYTDDPAAGYSMVQFFDGSWSSTLSQFVNGNETSNEFSFDRNAQIMVLKFSAGSLANLKQKGLIIQGFGAYLNRVIIVPASKINSLAVGDANADGHVSIVDAVSVVAYTETGNQHLINMKSADANSSNTVDGNDVPAIGDIILQRK